MEKFKKYLEKNLKGLLEIEIVDLKEHPELLEKVGETKTHCFICKYSNGFIPVAIDANNIKPRQWIGWAKAMNKDYEESTSFYDDLKDVTDQAFNRIKHGN